MKILLIDPPFYRILGFYNRYFPYGLTVLATFLKANGYPDVSVYDADFNERCNNIDYSGLPRKYPAYLASFSGAQNRIWTEVEETIRKSKPDVVGISVWTTFAAASFFTARLAKKAAPGCLVVMGGPHATVKADNILKICPDVDCVVRGEGEYPLLELVSALEAKRDFAHISGLSYREDGNILHNPSRQPAADLSRYPLADCGLLANQAGYSSEDMGLMMTSRGCPYSCAYCATLTGRIAYFPVDRIVEAIRHIKARYGTTQFTFKDDSFTVNSARLTEFCERLIREKAGISWECNTRVNLVTEPMLRLMKKAGCNFIKVGIESGSERVLKGMNKNITLAQSRLAAGLFRKVAIHWTGYFMIGVPGETEEDIRKTMDFMVELNPDFAAIGVYEPFPGTAMFEEGVRLGLLNPDMTLEQFYGTLPCDYYKRDPLRQTDRISPERFRELESEAKELSRRHNRGITRVAKMARAKLRVYANDPRLLWEDFNKFLSY